MNLVVFCLLLLCVRLVLYYQNFSCMFSDFVFLWILILCFLCFIFIQIFLLPVLEVGGKVGMSCEKHRQIKDFVSRF